VNDGPDPVGAPVTSNDPIFGDEDVYPRNVSDPKFGVADERTLVRTAPVGEKNWRSNGCVNVNQPPADDTGLAKANLIGPFTSAITLLPECGGKSISSRRDPAVSTSGAPLTRTLDEVYWFVTMVPSERPSKPIVIVPACRSGQMKIAKVNEKRIPHLHQ
jgi:hypothetical protein